MYEKLWKANLLVLALAASAFGQQGVQPQGNVAAGGVVPVEYSNNLDEMAVPGGGAHGVLDPLQVLYTEPLDGPPADGRPMDIMDFLGPAGEIDALANNGDFLFFGVVFNVADLLVSVGGDPPLPGNAVHFEAPGGAFGLLWSQANLSNPDPAGDVEDVDGLELWGPVGGWDANMFSLSGDAVTGTSVYFSPLGGVGAPYVPQAVIAAAVANPALAPNPYAGAAGLVDLDGLMVFDLGGWFDGVWNEGDWIIFSIRPAANWNGGEIVVLPFVGPPAYLTHGGHPWNTAWAADNLGGLAGTINVDGIEAYPSDEKSWLSGACCEPADLPGVPCVPNLTFAECSVLGGHWRVGAPCGATGECIPTVSQWGLVVMGLLVAAAATVVIMRRRAMVRGGS